MCGGRGGTHSSRTASSDGADRTLCWEKHRTFTPFTPPPKKKIKTNKQKKPFPVPTQEKTPQSLRLSRTGKRGLLAPWTPQPAQRSAAGLKNSLSLFTSACFHVPPVALHFEPVSNGGPRTDFPAEECALRLIHRTASQLSPSGTRGKDGAAGASRAGCSCTSARGTGFARGGFSVASRLAQLGQSGSNKSKRDAERSRLN